MNRKGIIIALVTVVMVLIMIIILGNSNQNALNPTIDESMVSTIQSVEIQDGEAVYVTLANGEQRQIAEFVPLGNNNFEDVRNYQSYQVSPNNRFVAIDGYAFEEGITQVYDAQTDTLYNTTPDTLIYGQIDSWTNEGLLQIRTCDLPRENCYDQISVSADTPWVVEEVSESRRGPDFENGNSDNNQVDDDINFNSNTDFITSINNQDNLSEFGDLLNEYAPRAIAGTGPFTVFVPTNSALFGVILNDATEEEIIDFIRNHVAAAEYRFNEFSAADPINTTGNDRLSFVQNSGVVRINNRANIVQPDLKSSNGIVHVIDNTVIPLNR